MGSFESGGLVDIVDIYLLWNFRPRTANVELFSLSYPFLTRYLPPVIIMAIVVNILSLLSLFGFACAVIANNADFKLSSTQLFPFASSGCSAASGSQISCQNTTTQTNLCCFESPGVSRHLVVAR